MKKKPPTQTIGIPNGQVITAEQAAEMRAKSVKAGYERLKRAYAKHRKEVMMVDPTMAGMLIDAGFAVECKVKDYDEAIDKKFRYDERYHKPIRLKTIQEAVK